MLKEYERIYAQVLNGTTHAEQRVNYFLTIASAAVGVLVVLSQISGIRPHILSSVAQGILVILLLYGLIIQNRLNMRDIQSKVNNQLLSKIQDYFGDSDPEIAAYLEYQRKLYKRSTPKPAFLSILINRFRGSLSDFIGLSNGLLCGGIVLVSLSSAGYDLPEIATWTMVTVFFSMTIIFVFIRVAKRFLSP